MKRSKRRACKRTGSVRMLNLEQAFRKFLHDSRRRPDQLSFGKCALQQELQGAFGRMVRISVLHDALKTMYNAEKRGKRQVLIRPSSKVVIKFLQVMMKHGEQPKQLHQFTTTRAAIYNLLARLVLYNCQQHCFVQLFSFCCLVLLHIVSPLCCNSDSKR